jgi:hypothetical protein
MRGFRADLIEFVGGKPDLLQTTLIERATVLRLRIALLDRQVVRDVELTEHASNHYIAWVNALRRTIDEIAKMADVKATETVLQKLQREGAERSAKPEASAPAPVTPSAPAPAGRPSPPRILPRMSQQQ